MVVKKVPKDLDFLGFLNWPTLTERPFGEKSSGRFSAKHEDQSRTSFDHFQVITIKQKITF